MPDTVSIAPLKQSPYCGNPLTARIQPHAVKFSGNAGKLFSDVLTASAKDLALFEERPDVKADDVVNSLLNTGENVFLTGPAGAGKSTLLQEVLRRLKSQKTPLYPDDGQPIKLMIFDWQLDELEDVLKVNRHEPAVVFAVEEFVSSVNTNETLLTRLAELKEKYPNLRLLVDQDECTMRRFTDPTNTDVSPGDLARLKAFFPKITALNPIPNPLEKLLKLLNATGFTVSPEAAQCLKGIFSSCPALDLRTAVTEIVHPLLNMVKAGLRQDDDTPEPLDVTGLEARLNPKAD